MEKVQGKVIELQANRTLFKKGQPFIHFYELFQGQLQITIGSYTIYISQKMIIGDYQLHQNIEYRLSTIKTSKQSTLKIYQLNCYNKIQHYRQQFQRSFDKFNFRNKVLKYWIKKLFFINILQKYQHVGSQFNVGVVLKGAFKIGRDIAIGKVKNKNMEVVKSFQICQLGMGQIFKGVLTCESTFGAVGICSQEKVKVLLNKFQEFKKVIEMADFKGEVHKSMEKDIANSCSKKNKLYRNLVPFPLKQHMKHENTDDNPALMPELKQQGAHLRTQRHTVDIFQVKNSISAFLHKQLRKQIKIFLRRKGDMSPREGSSNNKSSARSRQSDKKIEKKKENKERKQKDKRKELTIENPILVNLQNYRLMKKKKYKDFKSKFFTKQTQPLPQVKPVRFKTQGNQKTQRFNHYFKLLNFQQK